MRERVARTVSDRVRLRATFAMLSRLHHVGGNRVVARGSAAVFAHAPRIARVPNDLDVYWLGDQRELPDMVHESAQGSRDQLAIFIRQVKTLRPPHEQHDALHRMDVLVSGREQLLHRFWLDATTSRVAPPVQPMTVGLPGGGRCVAGLVDIAHLLAEKLCAYGEAHDPDRPDLRWTDLFDMLALLQAAPALEGSMLAAIASGCADYFRDRGRPLPCEIIEPPHHWLLPWFRQVGAVVRRHPTLPAAHCAITAFWMPVLDAARGSGLDGCSQWDPVAWTWVGSGSATRSARRPG